MLEKELGTMEEEMEELVVTGEVTVGSISVLRPLEVITGAAMLVGWG